GPDLAREGVGNNKKSNAWHYNHMLDPAVPSPGSIMPPYPWLFDKHVDLEMLPKKIRAMQTLGVPYPEGYDLIAANEFMAQADSIVADLEKNGLPAESTNEIVALIAYLQRLGRDIYNAPKTDKTPVILTEKE
ncbi:MAG: cbb3-type cytochrome c oxidase subunit II, partial [Flavobacteriales bacterium]